MIGSSLGPCSAQLSDGWLSWVAARGREGERREVPHIICSNWIPTSTCLHRTITYD